MLADAIVAHGLQAADQHTAADIRIGLGYTAVLLEDGCPVFKVADSAKVLQIVSEGGGTRQFGRAVRKLSLRSVTQ
jgi:hypothetical protein